MNAMKGNQHHDYADALSSESPHGDILEAKLAQAQAEATLALAYEQRTANLIPLWGMSDDACMALDTASGTGESDWSSIAKQIRERLGLA